MSGASSRKVLSVLLAGCISWTVSSASGDDARLNWIPPKAAPGDNPYAERSERRVVAVQYGESAGDEQPDAASREAATAPLPGPPFESEHILPQLEYAPLETDGGLVLDCAPGCDAAPPPDSFNYQGVDCGPGVPGGFLSLSGGYVKADYLMWWTHGMSTPPLVTTDPGEPLESEAGVLGQPGTEIVFGGSSLLEDLRHGGRVVLGAWLDPCYTIGIEAEWLGVGDAETHFSAESSGDPIYARPFFDGTIAEEAAELVAYPDVIEGAIDVDAFSRFSSMGIRFRKNLCCKQWCWTLPVSCCPPNPCSCGGCGVPIRSSYRCDLLVGYRYAQLDEGLKIREDLSSLDTQFPADFDILDQFDTENRFHGLELGLAGEVQYNRWSLEWWAKAALGGVHQVARIAGATTITDQITEESESFNEGILALRTNSGSFSQDLAGIIPEVGMKLGYNLSCRLRLTVGYNFIYWASVARPGDQIDLALNPNLFPTLGPAPPFDGPLRPEFIFRNADFWAQGLTFGGDFRW